MATSTRTLDIDAGHSIAVSCNNKLVLDGLVPTEEIESLLIKLAESGYFYAGSAAGFKHG